MADNYKFNGITERQGELVANFMNAVWCSGESYNLQELDEKIDELTRFREETGELKKGRQALQAAAKGS